MRINTNVSALAAARNLNAVQDQIKLSSDKLSSGFRINRAADDAAGLGVANTLRGDIRAYTQASSNAEQAQAVYNIAEGATSSIVTMLERMKELAVTANSDTVNSAARVRADTEFQALQAEISRTIGGTKFQAQALLNGSYGGGALSGTVDATVAGVYSVTQTGAAAATYTIASVSATVVSMTSGTTTQTVAFAATTAQALTFSQFGVTVNTDKAVANAGAVAGTVIVGAGAGGTFSVGASGTGDTLSISAADFDMNTLTQAATLGNVLTIAAANSALTAVNAALDQGNLVLGKIGAGQSRITSALGNLKSLVQNYEAAESTIRDVDYASEMVKFSKNQIMAQAGTAMLAQANQANQGVLRLFQ